MVFHCYSVPYMNLYYSKLYTLMQYTIHVIPYAFYCQVQFLADGSYLCWSYQREKCVQKSCHASSYRVEMMVANLNHCINHSSKHLNFHKLWQGSLSTPYQVPSPFYAQLKNVCSSYMPLKEKCRTCDRGKLNWYTQFLSMIVLKYRQITLQGIPAMFSHTLKTKTNCHEDTLWKSI